MCTAYDCIIFFPSRCAVDILRVVCVEATYSAFFYSCALERERKVCDTSHIVDPVLHLFFCSFFLSTCFCLSRVVCAVDQSMRRSSAVRHVSCKSLTGSIISARPSLRLRCAHQSRRGISGSVRYICRFSHTLRALKPGATTAVVA